MYFLKYCDPCIHGNELCQLCQITEAPLVNCFGEPIYGEDLCTLCCENFRVPKELVNPWSYNIHMEMDYVKFKGKIYAFLVLMKST